MSDSGSGDDVELYDFSFIQFMHKGRKRKVEQYDVVPSKWLEYDKKRGRCVVPYPEIQNNDDVEFLHGMIQNLADPPETWTKFTVKLIGRAKTHKEALEKMEILKYKEHCLSLESEDSVSSYQDKMISSVRRQQLMRQTAMMKETFKSKSVSTVHKSHTESSEEEETKEELKGKQNSKPRNEKNLAPQPKKKKSTPDSRTAVASLSKCSSSKSSEVGKRKKKLIDEEQGTGDIRPKEAVEPEAVLEHREGTGHDEGTGHEEATEHEEDAGHGETAGHEEDAGHGEAVEHEQAAAVHVEVPHKPEQKNVATLNLPILNVSNAKCSTPYETAMLAQMNFVVKEVIDIKKCQESVRAFLLDKRIVNMLNNEIGLSAKYNLNLPLKTLEEFYQFNDSLKNDPIFKNEVCYELTRLMDKNYSISKSFVNIMKKFMSKELALKFTAIRHNEKIKFRGTEFSVCMDVMMSGVRGEHNLETEEKDLISNLSDVICNVKKWP